MALNTGFTLPGSASNESAGDRDWDTPSNVLTDNNTYAKAGGPPSPGTTGYLNITNFGFSLPTGSIIQGIVVRIQREQGNSNVNGVDHTLQLLVGGVRSGDNKADTTNEWPTTSTNKDYGSSSDLWGLSGTLTESVVEASDFGVSFRVQRLAGGGINREMWVDVVWMDIYYVYPQTLTPGLFTNTNSFQTAVLTVGASPLTPSLFTNINSFYTPTLSSTIGLTPSLVTNTNSFFTPTVSSSYSLTPDLFTNSNSFNTHLIQRGLVDLTPSLFTNTNSFFTPSVTTGSVGLSPSLVTNTNSFFTPSVSVGAVNLIPTLLDNSNSFFQPTATYSYVLTPSVFTNTNIFYSATVSAGSIDLTPNLLTNTSTFFSPDVSRGTINLTPDSFINTNSFYTPSISSTVNLLPPRYLNSNVFFSPEVTGGVSLNPTEGKIIERRRRRFGIRRN